MARDDNPQPNEPTGSTANSPRGVSDKPRHRLAGAVEKFNRSKEQFDGLIAEMDAFFNRDPRPHTSAGEFDTESWSWIERFKVLEEPPLRFGVILGDCVHNLRSCLDHIIWQVTLLDDGTPNEQTQFPIASKSESQFEGMANRRIPGLSAEHRALVKRTQPYHAGDRAPAHPLAVLAALSNVDKHRIVHPTYSLLDMDTSATLDHLAKSYKGPGPSPIHGWWIIKGGQPLEDGTPWFRIHFRRDQEAPRKVDMRANLSLGIAFGDMGLDAANFRTIAEYVHRILNAFLAEFPETEYVDT